MAVRGAVGDARKEVKKEAEVLLRHMGQEVAGTPEIRGMADAIISSILDSANMDKACDAWVRFARCVAIRIQALRDCMSVSKSARA